MRVRFRHSKRGKVRFTSHRDTARHWERALRKAELGVVTSGGFVPRPKMSFGLALPTGAESIAEYLDVEMVDSFDLDDGDVALALAERISNELPVGYEVLRCATIGGDRQPSLQEDVVACTWSIDVTVDASQVTEAIATTLAATSLPIERERKGQRHADDVRPAIRELGLDAASGEVTATLATTHRGLRPAELLAVLFPNIDPFDSGRRVLRTHQWIERDGERRELLPLTAACPADEAVA